jgi:cell division protein FtsL
MVASVVAVLCIALSLVYLHVVLAQRQFRLDNLDSQIQQQQASYQKLRLQAAELGSPANIISMAEGHLGMIQPATITYLPYDSAGVTSSATEPSQPNGARVGQPASSGPRTTVVPAPQGDADWPLVKSQLAGLP